MDKTKSRRSDIVGMSKDSRESQNLQHENNELQIRLNKNFQKQLNSHEERLENLEDTMRVNGIQEKKLTDNVNRVVIFELDGKGSNAYEDRSIRGKAYSQINRHIKKIFGIPRRSEMPAKDYEKSLEVIENWIPDYELRQEISEANRQLRLKEHAK